MSAAVVDHAAQIVSGVLAEREALDVEIARLAPAIPVSELGKVERAILRSAGLAHHEGWHERIPLRRILVSSADHPHGQQLL